MILTVEHYGDVTIMAERLGWVDTYPEGDAWDPNLADAMEEECIEYIIRHSPITEVRYYD